MLLILLFSSYKTENDAEEAALFRIQHRKTSEAKQINVGMVKTSSITL